MKKNKKSLKKLSLNKNVISNLENGQIQGGTGGSVWICPILTPACPIITPACPVLTPACPILTPACPISLAGGCPTTTYQL